MGFKRMNLILQLLIFIIWQVHTQMSFVLKSTYTVSPNFAKSTASVYTFPFNAYNTVVGIINLRVDFPNIYQLTTASNCSIKIDGSIVSGTGCSFDSANNQVVINNINVPASFSTFDIQFTTATAKYSATTTVDFLFFNATTNVLIANYSQLVRIQNAIMTCSIASNSTVVGASSTYSITFIPSVQIQANSIVQFQFDKWGPFQRSNFGSANATSVCSGQCSITFTSSIQVELVVFSSLYSTASNATRTITLNSARNPASFSPIKLKITISASDGSIYMIGNTTFAASQTNTFNSLIFDTPNKSISAVNSNINLRITPRNPIHWNTFLRITYMTPQLSLSYSFSFNTLVSTPTQVSNQPVGQMLIGSLTRNTITSEPTLLSMGNFNLINPPYSQKPVTINFRTQQLIGSSYFPIDQFTLQITSSSSTIVNAGVSANVRNIGSITTYSLWFVTVNRLVPGSYVKIVFPAQIKLNQTTSTCTLTNSGIVSNCVADTLTSIKVTLSSVVNAGTNLTLTITLITNPLTTVPTDSFIIRTYYSDDITLVDQLTSNLTIKAIQVPLRSVTVDPTSRTVYARTSYKISIQSSYDIPTSSIIKITFPPQISQGGQSLQSFSIDMTPVTGCILTQSNNSYIQFSNLCIKNVIKNTQTINIVLNNVINPTSFKPTSSFVVEIFNGIYKQEYLNTDIIVTMNQMATIPYFKVTPDTLSANEVNMYTFEVNFVVKHFSGDRILIKFPSSQVQLSSQFNCSSLTINTTISCSKLNSQTLLFILNYVSSTYPTSGVKFTLSDFTNNWYASTKTFYVQTTTNDTTYFYQQESSAVVSYQAAKMVAGINNDNNIVLVGVSKVVLTLTSPFVLTKATDLSLIYIIIQIPTQFIPINGTCIPSVGGSLCTQISSQIFNVTNVGDFSSSLTVRFSAQTTFFQNSSNFDIKIYYSSSLVLSNSEVRAQRYCSTPCKQCTATRTQCLSCLPSPIVTQTIYLSFNSTCVSSCPDTYYLNQTSKSCQKCNANLCKLCQSNSSTCTACNTGRYLFNKTCFSVCPNGYYALNGQCLLCSHPCLTCSNSSTFCLSCATNFSLDYGTNNNTCVRTCSNSNYLGLDGSCRQCTSNCKTCQVSLNNCTSCDQTNYHYFNFTCVRNCPSGMYSSASGACIDCDFPCVTCSAKTICHSCADKYYLYNNQTCTNQCPNGFLGLVNQCIKCDPKCATCSVTLSNCTSCPSGKLLYQNDCLDQCPALTYPYNKTCTRCIIPCVTCSSSPQICLTCTEGLLLLNNTCVPSCPLSGYIKQDGQCLACPLNCLTCQNSIKCVLCSNQYNLLQGGCVQNCPANYPIVQNRQCYQCDSVCLTCSTSKQNCTSCKINFFKYRYTCVQSCPLGYYSDVQSNQCLDGLGTKIAFFPILIISIIIISFAFTAKFVTLQTSLPTVLTSLLSLSELAIWIYMIGQLTGPIKQLNVDYNLPIAMFIIAILSLVTLNIVFYIFSYKKMSQDDYVRGWAINNVNYTVLAIHRYTGLVINFKFFRLVYSRFFNMRTLSLPFAKNENIFPLTTIFSLLNLLLCQIPMIVGSFSLVYKKLLKDQIFYTSIECLVVTIICAVLLLIDIFKSQQYFEENDYVKTKKYLQKIKDASFNRLEDQLDINKDQGSIQGEKYISRTGGKFIFSKEDPSSLKQLFFQQQAGSTISDGLNSIQTKMPHNSTQRSRSFKKINIFDPIKQQDEQLYQDLKYSQQQIKTQAQLQQQRQQSVDKHKQHQYAIAYQQQKSRRARDLGLNTDDLNFDLDDNRSMIEERPLKEKWNNIITHRQRLAKSIFNTFDAYSTKQLQKIIQPIDQIDQYQDDARNTIQDPFRSTQYAKSKKNKRRRKKMPNQPGNSQLQKIYLQRLTQKKQYKDIFASSQSIKYDF